MDAPEQHATVQIEYEGKEYTALVDDVRPDPESQNWQLITLIVDGPFQPRTQAYWLVDGQRAPAGVHAVATQHGITKIVMRWISG
jgi:hypothetical protein